MQMWSIAITSSICIILVAYTNYYLHPWSRQQKKYREIVRRTKERFVGRSRHTPEEFAALYFPEEQQAIALKLAEILIKLDFLEPDFVSLMIPSDRLIEDLGIGVADGYEMNELVTAIEKNFGIGLDEEAEAVLTIGQLVGYIEWKIRKL